MSEMLGEQTLTHEGKSVQILFSWAAIQKMIDVWGDDYLDQATKALEARRLKDVAFIISCCSNMTVAEVMNWSPPITPTIESLNTAWAQAWIGNERLAQVMSASKKVQEVDPQQAQLGSRLWGLLSRLRLKPGSTGLNSGG